MVTTITFDQARAQLFPQIFHVSLDLEIENKLLLTAIKSLMTAYAFHSVELCKRAQGRYKVEFEDSGSTGKVEGETTGDVIKVEFPVAAWGRHARFDVTARSMYEDKLKELVETILFEVGNAQRKQAFRDLDRNSDLTIINWGKRKAAIELENDFLFLNALQKLETVGIVPSKLYQKRLGNYRGSLGDKGGFIAKGGRTRHLTTSQLVTEELYAYGRVAGTEVRYRLCKILENLMVNPSPAWQTYASDVTDALTGFPDENLSLYLMSLQILEKLKQNQGVAINTGTEFTAQMLAEAGGRSPLKEVTKAAIRKWLSSNNVDLQL